MNWWKVTIELGHLCESTAHQKRIDLLIQHSFNDCIPINFSLIEFTLFLLFNWCVQFKCFTQKIVIKAEEIANIINMSYWFNVITQYSLIEQSEIAKQEKRILNQVTNERNNNNKKNRRRHTELYEPIKVVSTFDGHHLERQNTIKRINCVYDSSE